MGGRPPFKRFPNCRLPRVQTGFRKCLAAWTAQAAWTARSSIQRDSQVDNCGRLLLGSVIAARGVSWVGGCGRRLLWRRFGPESGGGGSSDQGSTQPPLAFTARVDSVALSCTCRTFCTRYESLCDLYPQETTKALRNSLLRKALQVGARRLELQTSSLSGTRSNQLSYAPNIISCWPLAACATGHGRRT